MEFGVVGFDYGEVRPKSVTFFIDGTAKVSDHRGNAIRGYSGTHREVVQQLTDARVEWQTLDCAGFPQLPYAELSELPSLPETPLDELMKIKDKTLRADAVRARREVDEARQAELAAAD